MEQQAFDMSHWTCIVFEPGDSDPETAESTLRAAIQDTDVDICRSDEQADLNTWVADGRVYWRLHGFSFDRTVPALDIVSETLEIIE